MLFKCLDKKKKEKQVPLQRKEVTVVKKTSDTVTYSIITAYAGRVIKIAIISPIIVVVAKP